MKCQNVQIGDALYHSIKVAASERWPAFGEQSKIVYDWYTKKHIYIPFLIPGSCKAHFASESADLLFNGLAPEFKAVRFAPAAVPELPHNVEIEYSPVIDTLLIALRSGGIDETR